MNSKKTRIAVFIIFISIMVFFTVVNIPNAVCSLGDSIKDDTFGIGSFSNNYAEGFSFKYAFVNLEGGVKNILDTNEFNTIKKIENATSDGGDTFVSSVDYSYTVNVKAQRVIDLKDIVSQNDTDFVFVGLPHEIAPYDSNRLSDYSNVMLDSMLESLNGNGVDTIDMRKYIYDNYNSYYDAFYRTDHHWTVETALGAFSDMFEEINQKYDMGIDDKFLNVDEYDLKYTDSRFLGSNGRKVGITYTGFDTYNAYSPKFETSFAVTKDGEYKEGTFDDVFLYPEYCDGDDYFTKEQFYTYLGKDAGFISITNRNDNTGKKVLVFRDSYSRPLICAMASCFGKVDAIDLRHLDGNVSDYVNHSDYDLVIVSYCPYMIINDRMFEFD